MKKLILLFFLLFLQLSYAGLKRENLINRLMISPLNKILYKEKSDVTIGGNSDKDEVSALHYMPVLNPYGHDNFDKNKQDIEVNLSNVMIKKTHENISSPKDKTKKYFLAYLQLAPKGTFDTCSNCTSDGRRKTRSSLVQYEMSLKSKKDLGCFQQKMSLIIA